MNENTTEQILLDLIAELRDDGIEEVGIPPQLGKARLDRAEARLREIGGRDDE